MAHHDVLGSVILARNGDRTECYQHPITQKPGPTRSTPLGEVRVLPYFDASRFPPFPFPFMIAMRIKRHPIIHRSRRTSSGNTSVISTSTPRPLHTSVVSVPTSSTSLKSPSASKSVARAPRFLTLPPRFSRASSPRTRTTRSRSRTRRQSSHPLGATSTSPLRLLSPATIARSSPGPTARYVLTQVEVGEENAPCERTLGLQAFQRHVQKVYATSEFKEASKAAQPFFHALRDFAFGRELTLENAYNVRLAH